MSSTLFERAARALAPLGASLLFACSSAGFDLGAPISPSDDADTAPVDTGPLDTGATSFAPDAVSDAAIDTAPSCEEVTFVATADADAQIIQESPTLNWGGAGLMEARNDLGGPVFSLVRFDLGGVPEGAKITSATLSFSWSSNANDCAPSCGSCASIDRAGDVDLYFARNDWLENKVDWSTRDGASPWGSAGAELAGVDRSSTPIATFTHTLGGSSDVTLDATAIAALSAWRGKSNEVTFLLQAQASTVLLVATREGRTLCPSTGAPPKLVVRTCA